MQSGKMTKCGHLDLLDVSDGGKMFEVVSI
jgi:hypothetical protein